MSQSTRRKQAFLRASRFANSTDKSGRTDQIRVGKTIARSVYRRGLSAPPIGNRGEEGPVTTTRLEDPVETVRDLMQSLFRLGPFGSRGAA